VRDRVGALAARDVDLRLGDQRPGDRGAEQVDVLVDGAGAQHREDEVAHELLAQVLDVDRRGPALLRLGACRLEFLALAEIGAEGDDRHLVALDQPGQDDRGVEAAGVRQYDFLRGLFHGLLPVCGAPVRRFGSDRGTGSPAHRRTGSPSLVQCRPTC
jgi:hypothetical protein